jgi:hypothetical protein
VHSHVGLVVSRDVVGHKNRNTNAVDSVCLVSIIRLHALVVLVRHPEDPTFYGTQGAYWSSIEVNLGIVCACAPALKPLVVKIIPHFSSRYGSGRSMSKGTKESSKDRKSFIELKGQPSSTTMSDDLERGDAGLTALPAVRSEQGPRTIQVKTDLEQRVEQLDRDMDTGSEQDLVIKSKALTAS